MGLGGGGGGREGVEEGVVGGGGGDGVAQGGEQLGLAMEELVHEGGNGQGGRHPGFALFEAFFFGAFFFFVKDQIAASDPKIDK